MSHRGHHLFHPSMWVCTVLKHFNQNVDMRAETEPFSSLLFGARNSSGRKLSVQLMACRSLKGYGEG